MKRILLFLVTNIAVLLVLTIIMQVFGIGQYLTQQGIDYSALLVFSAVIGFAGSIISLLISKPMAKWSTGAKVIATPAERDGALARHHRQAPGRPGANRHA